MEEGLPGYLTMNEHSSLASDHPDSTTARLLQVVELENVSRQGLCCAIRLWPEWASMMDMLPQLGDVLTMSGNEGAIFGRRGVFPALSFTDRYRRAVSECGGFEAQFRAWAFGTVTCHTHEGRSSFAIEFRDEARQILHKISLLESSRIDRFVDWVEYHQAMPWPSAEEVFTPARWPVVPQRSWLDYDQVEPLPENALEGVIRHFTREQISLRAKVGQHGVTQAGEFTAQSLGRQGEWLFASDDEAGLHVNPAHFEEHVLHYEPENPFEPERATLKSYLADGNLGLTLSAPTYLPEREWRTLLQKALSTL